MEQHTARAAAARVRGVRVGDAPTVSVLVTSSRERFRLDACLATLLPKCEAMGAEVIILRAGTADEVAELEVAYPSARFVAVAAGSSTPQMRVAGMAAAEGDIVLLQEDVPLPADWVGPRMLAGLTGAESA